jgi:hypothetical protein
MDFVFFIAVVGGYIGAAEAGGNWRHCMFWPYYAAKKIGYWATRK